jgi:hypothetical protein
VQLHYYAMFFVVVFAFGNYVLFALFAAILLSHFDSDEAEEDEEEVPEEFNETPKKGCCARTFSRETYESIRWGFIDMFGKRLREKNDENCEPVSSPKNPEEFIDKPVQQVTEQPMKDGQITERPKTETPARPANPNQVAALDVSSSVNESNQS